MPVDLFIVEIGRKFILGIFGIELAIVVNYYYLRKEKTAEGLNAVYDICNC